MKQLTILANKYQSDKGTEYSSKHNFSDIYDDYFEPIKHKTINILEIGIHDGSSLKMWYDYFPNASIYGLDIDNKDYLNNDRTACGILDQSNEEYLKYFVENINLTFDIIIDDGSHHMKDQQITFGHLFKLLKSEGIYIIEDLHTSLCENGLMIYGKPIEIHNDKKNTTLYYLNNKCNQSVYLNDEQNDFIKNNIKEVFVSEQDNLNVPIEYKHKSITSIILKK